MHVCYCCARLTRVFCPVVQVLDPGSEGNQQEPAAPTEGMATTTAEGRSEGEDRDLERNGKQGVREGEL